MSSFVITDVPSQPSAVVRGRVRADELAAFFGRAFTAVAEVLAAQGVEPTGPPFGYYPCMPGEFIDVEAGFPTADLVEASGDVVPLVLPHGRVARGLHVGPYDTLTDTYAELQAWVTEQGEQLGEQMWECYLSDPAEEPDPATWRTEVIWLLHTPA